MEIKDYTEMAKAHQELREIHDKFQNLYETSVKMVQDMDANPIIQMLTYVMETAKPLLEAGLLNKQHDYLYLYLGGDYFIYIRKNKIDCEQNIHGNNTPYFGQYDLRDGKWILKTYDDDFRNLNMAELAEIIEKWPRNKQELLTTLESRVEYENKKMVVDAKNKSAIMKTIQEFKV